MTKIDIEIWKSSQNNTEVHIFKKGTQTYILGFNPELISLTDVNTALDMNGFEEVTDDQVEG